MEACFRYMCRVDDAGGLTGTLTLEDFLLLLSLRDENGQDTLAIRSLFDDAVSKTQLVSGKKPDTLRFFAVPSAESGDFGACIVSQIAGGVRFIFTNDCDFIRSFVEHDYSLTIWR